MDGSSAALGDPRTKWKLKLVPGHRVEPEPLITLRPKYGMRMQLESRDSISPE